MYQDLKSFFDRMVPLKPYEWTVFNQLIKVKSFDKGDIITRAGSVEHFLYFISKGATRIYYLKDGSETNIAFRLEGQFVSSYASFVTQTPSKQYVEAIEDTTLYAMHYKHLQMLYGLSKNGERLGRLNAELSFIEKEDHEASLMLKSPDERFNELVENKKDWLQRISQKHLASYLNLTPETFSRLKRRSMEQSFS